MIRTALAAILAVSLLAAVLPTVDAAREDRTETRLRADVDRLDSAVRDLTATEDATSGVAGARRVVTIRLPERSWSSAGVDAFTVGGTPGGDGDRDVVSYTLADGTTRTHDVGGDLRTPYGPVVFGPGRHRVVLSLVAAADGPTVVVTRG